MGISYWRKSRRCLKLWTTSLSNLVSGRTNIYVDSRILMRCFDANDISRQLRSFLLSSSASERSSNILNFNNPEFDSYSESSTTQEEKYFLTILVVIKNLLLKEGKHYFSIPMIREGILDVINDMFEHCKTESVLPSFKYIKSKIDNLGMDKVGEESSDQVSVRI